jgi:hypothetical protein
MVVETRWLYEDFVSVNLYLRIMDGRDSMGTLAGIQERPW